MQIGEFVKIEAIKINAYIHYFMEKIEVKKIKPCVMRYIQRLRKIKTDKKNLKKLEQRVL